MTTSQIISLALIAVGVTITVLNILAVRRLTRRTLPRILGIQQMSDDELAHIVAQIVIECHRRGQARAEVDHLNELWRKS